MTIDPLRSRSGIPLSPVDRDKTVSPKSSPSKTDPVPPKGDADPVAPSQRFHSRLLAAAKLVLQELPDPHTARLEEIKEHLRSGAYLTPEVQRRVAEKILQDPELRAQTTLDPERLQLIKNRIQKGFYDREEVKRAVADKLAQEAKKAITESDSPE